MQGRMATKSGSLEQAITLLIQNQALFQSEMSQAFREMREMKEKLDVIEKILIQHSQTLAGLPEAIRQKVGLKNR
jgi:DNA-binding protein H-NS